MASVGDYQTLSENAAKVFAHATDNHITDPLTDATEVCRLIDGLRAQAAYCVRQEAHEGTRRRLMPNWIRLRDEARTFREHTVELARLLHQILSEPESRLSGSLMDNIEIAINKLHQSQTLYGPALASRDPLFLDKED